MRPYHGSQYNPSAFEKLVHFFLNPAVLAVSGMVIAGGGGWYGVNAYRASNVEKELVAAHDRLYGAKSVWEREDSILSKEKGRLNSISERFVNDAERAEFLGGLSAPDFHSKANSIFSQDERDLTASVKDEEIVKNALALRPELSNYEFAGQAGDMLLHIGNEVVHQNLVGYASSRIRNYLDLNERLLNSLNEKEATVRRALRQAAKNKDYESAAEANASAYMAEATRIADQETDKIVSGFLTQADEAGRVAFAKEGESYGSSEREEVLNAVKNDPNFQKAVADVKAATYEGAMKTLDSSHDSFSRESATAAAVLSDLGDDDAAWDSLSVAQASMLLLWSSNSFYTETERLSMLNRGISLNGVQDPGLSPKASLTGQSLPAPSKSVTNKTTGLSFRAPDNRPVLTSAFSKAWMNGSKASMNPGIYRNVAVKVEASAKSLASQTASRVATQTASQAASTVASKAASQTASTAAAKAASQTASTAASKAASQTASTAASKAASQAASTAASKAASQAASAAASRAASQAASAAASRAASQAASAAASRAASQAASAAASRAASSAAAASASRSASASSSRR